MAMRTTKRGGVNPATGFTQVTATREELDAWHAKYPRRYPPYRSKCSRCGTRIWHTGIGIGSHRRACKGSFCERVAWFHYEHSAEAIAKRVDDDPAAWAGYLLWFDRTERPTEVGSRQLGDEIRALIADGTIEDTGGR